MKIEFDIKDDRKFWLDELVHFHGLPDIQTLFELLVEDAYNYMREKEDIWRKIK